MVFDVLNYR